MKNDDQMLTISANNVYIVLSDTIDTIIIFPSNVTRDNSCMRNYDNDMSIVSLGCASAV